MRARFVLAAALAALVTLAACSSDASPPARVTNYGQAPGPTTYGSGAPDRGPTYAAPQRPGVLNWHTRLADAQAEARRTGKLILALATKPRCGLCDKFKNQIAPANAGALGDVAVAYVYDITRPEVRAVDQTIRANNRGASLMPLVGFLTADLRYVHGFSGPRSVSQFRGDIATASGRNPRRSARLDETRAGIGAAMAVVNEYGEREWSPPGDVWPTGEPEPIDAITGSPALPAGPSGALTDPSAMPALADAGPPALPPAPGALELPALEPAAPAPLAVLPPLPEPTPTAGAAASTDPAAASEASSSWSAPAARASARAAREPVAAADAVDTDGDEAWARSALERALTRIQEGRFGSAGAILSEVRDRLPGTTVAREASRGTVALYNAKRIRLAPTGEERSRYLARARRDLATSMWSVLFNG